MKNELNQMRSQINQLNQQMNTLPRFRGRFASTYAQEQYNEMMIYRNQLQMQVNQESAYAQSASEPEGRPESQGEDRRRGARRREGYHQALQDLRTLADSITEKYAELAKDAEVKKAIAGLGKGKREKPKLGPSHDFLNNVKLLEKLEKAEAAGDAFQEKPSPRTARSRGRTKSKRSSATATPARKTRRVSIDHEMVSATFCFLASSAGFSGRCQAEVSTMDPRGPHAARPRQQRLCLDLYGQIAHGDGNRFISPFSISCALAMTYAGARGETAAQVAKALHFSLPADSFTPRFTT